MGENCNLPPGFRFYPTEEELVSFYLYNKLEGGRLDFNAVVHQIIPVLDIYHFNPWDLPQLSGEVCKRDEEQWFFFIPRQESEARGGRPKRVTSSGYWKATGSPTYIYSSNNHKTIGIKRSMVFYIGRAPKGTKTPWKMNEYKLINIPNPNYIHNKLSLCRIYKKSKTVRAFDRRPPPLQVEALIPAELQPTTSQPNDNIVGGDQFEYDHELPNPLLQIEALIPIEQGPTTSQQNVDVGGGDHEFEDDQKLPNLPLMAVVERRSSPESFSSGDHHGDQSATNNNNNMQLKMEVDNNNELVWDWNHLNWL